MKAAILLICVALPQALVARNVNSVEQQWKTEDYLESKPLQNRDHQVQESSHERTPASQERAAKSSQERAAKSSQEDQPMSSLKQYQQTQVDQPIPGQELLSSQERQKLYKLNENERNQEQNMAVQQSHSSNEQDKLTQKRSEDSMTSQQSQTRQEPNKPTEKISQQSRGPYDDLTDEQIQDYIKALFTPKIRLQPRREKHSLASAELTKKPQQNMQTHQSQSSEDLYKPDYIRSKQSQEQNVTSQEQSKPNQRSQQSQEQTMLSKRSQSSEEQLKLNYKQSQQNKVQAMSSQELQHSQEQYKPSRFQPSKSSLEQSKHADSDSTENSRETNTGAFIVSAIVQPQSIPMSQTYRRGPVEITKYFNRGYPISKQINVQYDGRTPQVQFGDGITWQSDRMETNRPTVRGPRNAPSYKQGGTVNILRTSNFYDDATKNMRHLTDEELTQYRQAIVSAADNEDARLNATELLKKNQRDVETHQVKTDDGYVLTMFRIPAKQQNDQAIQMKAPVFVMHGLLGSADEWLLNGPGKSLAYLLADAGHEVWLGNARGSRYSRRHVMKSAAEPDFWQFSNDEIALHDLPAMIDYVLEISEQKKLHYVAHSLGTTVFFALVSNRPEYNDKFITMQAMSPMAYMTNVRSPLMKLMSPVFSAGLTKLAGKFQLNEDWLNAASAETMVGKGDVSKNVYFIMSGLNQEEVEPSMIPVIMGHVPAGGSARQMKQYGQAVASNEFRMYDHGAAINVEKYGSERPSKYDLKAVRTPVALYYSEEDWLASPKDVERLASELANVTDKFMVPVPHFANIDFKFGKSAPEVVYSRLIQNIERNNQKNASTE